MSTTQSTPIPAPLAGLHLSPTQRPAEHFLVREGREDQYDLDAPYQRGAVWTPEQQANLIRSLLQGIPIGSVIVAFQGYDTETTWRVIDGQQRIRALRAWFAGEVATPAWWWPARYLDGGEARRAGPDVTINDLSVYGQRSIYRWNIATAEIDSTRRSIPADNPEPGASGWVHIPVTDLGERLRFEATVYGLVNTGGTAQTPADLDLAADVAEGRRGVTEVQPGPTTVTVGWDPPRICRNAHEVTVDGVLVGWVIPTAAGPWLGWLRDEPDSDPVVDSDEQITDPNVAANTLVRRLGLAAHLDAVRRAR